MRDAVILHYVIWTAAIFFFFQTARGLPESQSPGKNKVSMQSGAESVIWMVQLSDLHFSVHNPDRAVNFSTIVGPAIRVINPSLVFVTGDLTDGKSKDLLVMKQNEEEWREYQRVMEEVVRRSDLKEEIFYDLRGNHDSFGVPEVGGSFDFYSKYSINGRLGRRGNVQSVTVETDDRRHLFVGVDSAMQCGLRGPTNLFGHPDDDLLSMVDDHLSQWGSETGKPVTKVALGHFPISFSAFTPSGRSLKDVFLKHRLSAYLCGHLHTKFGKNLKRQHVKKFPNYRANQEILQWSMHPVPIGSRKNCSSGAEQVEEFWEWEMGDWRRSRVMRIVTIDKGLVSFVDIDFKNMPYFRTTVVPTFPLDSRFMTTSSLFRMYECQHMIPPSFESIRALVFSSSPIEAVTATIFDSESDFKAVMKTRMAHNPGYTSRGRMYTASWNYRAFEDDNPLRFWLQIEAIDEDGRPAFSELRPFSINGFSANTLWTWKEFLVMGFQWATLYYPVFCFFIFLPLFILLLPKAMLAFSKEQFTYKSVAANKTILLSIAWILQELSHITIPYYGFIAYVLHLVLFPIFSGRIFTDGDTRAFMTYLGWAINRNNKNEYIGSPDVMVIMLPHLVFVVLPSIFVVGALAMERSVYRERILALSSKKEHNSELYPPSRRWTRNMLLIASLWIGWKHFQNCRRMMKAYEMNPVIDFPVYTFAIPSLMVVAVYATHAVAGIQLKLGNTHFGFIRKRN